MLPLRTTSLWICLSEDGRSGTFVIGNDHFPTSLLDLPCIVESYKTYDDSVLIKTANVGQIIVVREKGDPAPEVVEYCHGLTPPMRDARRQRFRREPDLNPELVRRIEKDLLSIMNGGAAENIDVDTQAGGYEDSVRPVKKKTLAAAAPPPNVSEAGKKAVENERSDSNESDDSI